MKSRPLSHFFVFLALFTATLACIRSIQNRSVNHAEFRFDVPTGWQEMSELWGTHRLQEDFYGLGAQELVALTSVQKKGEFGVWFSVAKKPLAGESLAKLVETTCAEAVPEVANVQQSERELDGQAAIAVRYQRPWGEPWWEFYDVWVEKDGFAYLLSFHALSLEGYQSDIDLILQSFSFQR